MLISTEVPLITAASHSVMPSSAVRSLTALARGVLGNDVILYTTDPPPYIANGTLPGEALFSCAPSPFSRNAALCLPKYQSL